MKDSPDALLMGIDGGQTSVKCAVATLDGKILGQGQGRGLIHLAAPGGVERFLEAIGEGIQATWASAGLAPRPLAALAMGLTGVTSAQTPEAQQAEALAGKLVTTERVLAENDALAALVGAHAGGPGVICIAGTGAITLGQDSSRRQARAGGWGWLLGDEGSAFWIGREALRAAMKAQEGLGPHTGLLPVLQQRFRVDAMIHVKRVVFSAEFGAQGFASLAPLVNDLAASGDVVAAAILRQAGEELSAAVFAVARRLAFGAESIPVAPVGGAFEHFPLLRQSFSTCLNAGGAFAVVEPSYPPVIGAVFMARALHLEHEGT